MNERLNVRRMQMPESKREAGWFDPSEEITERDYELFNQLIARKVSEDPFDVIRTAGPVAILGGRKSVRLNDLVLERMKDNSLSTLTDSFRNTFWKSVKSLFPDKMPEIRNDMWAGMVGMLRTYQNESRWADVCETAAAIMCMDPIRPTVFDKRTWEKLSIILGAEKRLEIHAFAERASNIKMFAPEHAPELSQQDWERLRHALSERKRMLHESGSAVSVWQFLDLASDIKILAAQSVNITKDTFEIVMPKKQLQEDIPPQPQALELK